MMRAHKFRQCWTFWLVALCIVAAAANLDAQNAATSPSPPKLVRIAIVDRSGSMDGERIQAAVEELLGIARSLPPSAELPIIVIPFAGDVMDVREFTDLSKLEAYLKGLRAGGGTRIAAALGKAVQVIERYDRSQQIVLMIVTDGEDQNVQAIAAEEKVIDRLFASRSERRLGNTVVFVKRWELANDALLRLFKQHGHARVVDAGELAIVPLTFRPTIRLAAARWDEKQLGILELSAEASCVVQGTDQAKQGIKPIQFACVTPGCEGNTTVTLPSGSSGAKRLDLRLSYPKDQVLQGVKGRLDFRINMPDDTSSEGDRVVLGTLTAESLSLDFAVPPMETKSRIVSMTISSAGPGRWLNFDQAEASYPVTVRIRVESTPDLAWDKPVSFDLEPSPHWQIDQGPIVLRLDRPGTLTQTLSLVGHPSERVLAGAEPLNISVKAKVKDLPPHHQLTPSELSAAAPVQLPPSKPTRVSSRVISTSPGRWTNLAQSLVAVEASVEFDVKGPLPRDTVLALRCPPSVQHVSVLPDRLKPGIQTVRIGLVLAMAPSPKPIELLIPIIPPPARGVIDVQPDPIRLSVRAPKPLQLVLVQRPDGIVSDLNLKLGQDGRGVLTAWPVLLGMETRESARGLAAGVQGENGITLGGDPRLPVLEPARLSIEPGTQDLGTRSFWRDTVFEVNVIVLPTPPTPAVLGSRQSVLMRLDAPGKRLVFFILCGLAGVLTFYLVGALIYRLTNVADEKETPAA